MTPRKGAKAVAREKRAAAARKGWRTRKKRERAEKRAAKARAAKREKKRAAQERAIVRKGRVSKRSPVPRGRRGKKGRFLPRASGPVERAWEIRWKLDRKYPERVKVFYLVDGETTRRFSVESWDRFMSDESYESRVEALLEEGEFWIGIQGEDGGVERLTERLA